MRHTKKKILPFVFASGLLASSLAHAAQLGKLELLSGAGEPFVAEIQIDLLAPEERSSLKAKLASEEAFKAARLVMDPSLKSLQFEVLDGSQPGTARVKITTSQPLPAGFIDTLVELTWAGGRVAREYTLTIPVSAAKEQGPAISLPEIRPPMTPPAVTAEATPPQSLSVAEAAPATVSQGATLTVRRGDTLSELALQLVGNGVSLNQAMAAMYEANKDSFIGGSVHLIREGAQIQVPNRAALRAKSANEALLVLAQNDDRNVYSAYARQIGLLTVENQNTADSLTSAQGAIAPQQKAAAEPAIREDRLQIAPSSTQGAGNADANAEELLAKNKALAEANERIALLEKNVSDLQRLLDMQGDLAEAPVDAPVAVPSEAAPEDAPVDAAEGDLPSMNVESEASLPVEPDNNTDATVDVPAETPADVPVEEQPFDWLPWILAGAGGLVVLVVLLLILRARRRKPEEEEGEGLPGQDDSSFSEVNEFDEAIAAASAGIAGERTSTLSQTENSDFDLDEVLNDRLKSADSEKPAAIVAEPARQDDFPALNEASEEAMQQKESLDSEVSLDFPEEDQVEAKSNSILDDLDEIEKGTLAAQEELDEIRKKPQADDDEVTPSPDDLVDQSPVDKKLDVPSSETDSPDSVSEVLPEEDFDKAMVDLDVDVPDPKIDDATWQEVATKLDLAGAYVEIGDADGAKELLNEIVKKGDADQIRKAKALLATLS